jgi:hypothetical protein
MVVIDRDGESYEVGFPEPISSRLRHTSPRKAISIPLASAPQLHR